MIKDATNTLNIRRRALFRLAVLLPIILISIAVTAQKTQGRKGTFIVPNRKCAVDFLISDIEAKSLKHNAEDEEAFYVSQDDGMYYSVVSWECLEKHRIKIVRVPATYKYAKFPDGTVMPLSADNQFTIMLYMPGRKPKEADTTTMEDEIKDYFRPVEPKKTQRK
ncbi:hypothetical protein HMPREF0663_11231 [Hoylesella oralis ATCC 33269]|uniref:Uncharacterized protein n=1 Tax=Hoylesella oralis ATCC 33269 TaxID=873533 RepID=E7RPY0_9BACT|nr:hypothetical protein [Hoylesella oralis]EFZ37173.1 hypothetical protein HMPREF0663_11231 [Hoylesella oralis ATCC 33269]EPH16236.1 hypothetical protein HMPREF1475_01979 [Hoylesella oralis HGA0225]SHF83310.1 hypothetical protein SAMN05444288_1641 [Hoylesella oralis]